MNSRDKRKVMRRVLLLFMALVLVLAPIAAPRSYADELDDAKDQLDQTNKDIDQTKNQIKEGKAQSQSLLAQIQQLESEINTTSGEIEILSQQLADTQGKVDQTQAELTKLENDINRQNESLSKRLRMMYESGDIGMISVLLGSSSMTELMNNYELMQRIYKADADLIVELEKKHEDALVRKTELMDLKTSLETQKRDLDEKKLAMSRNARSVASLRAQIDKNTAVLEQMVDDLKKEADNLKAEILKLQSSGKYAGGKMCWPAAGSARVTSPFGYRVHPIFGSYKFHTGIDIGADHNTNILAANSGKVITTVINRGTSGYGTYVIIDHGGGITTLYAHCESILVTKGQQVSRGQVIAKVGTTGASTGYHLHFEVRIDGQYQNPLDYVTPGNFYYD